jgi:hypothetical protein
MRLSGYYLADPRLILVPIEHLTTEGMSRELAAFLRDRGVWDAARTDLFDQGFCRYWVRSSALAARTRTWVGPRLRHVAIVTEPDAVRPYVQLLNTSAWLLYAGDFDPEISHPELLAYLLVHGDRLALSGDVATAPLHVGAYWLERGDEECEAFVGAAERATRPDAAILRATAAALPWLRALRHETLRPAPATRHHAVPGTGLLVPDATVAEPPRLVATVTAAARETLARYQSAWCADPRPAIVSLCQWLVADAPPLVVTTQGGRLVWDPSEPRRLGALRNELRQGDRTGVEAIAEDLRVIADHTRAFRAALVDPEALSRPAQDAEQQGYAYIHRERALIAYNLRESGIERLRGPALPYARAMLGARTVHEWAHLAVDTGWVPLAAPARLAEIAAEIAAELEAAIATAPAAIRTLTAVDVDELASGGMPAGVVLARLLLARMPDYQANLVAMRFLDEAERETYVRHNVRTLRPLYPPGQLWRLLIRYLYEYQYLGFSAVTDARAFFVGSTWLDADFFATGALDEARFDRLTAAVARLCACYAVDESRFRRRDAATERAPRES